MERVCNKEILEVLEHAKQLMSLADEGQANSTDNGCAVLYGVVRDCAYKMRAQAENEKENHKIRGIW